MYQLYIPMVVWRETTKIIIENMFGLSLVILHTGWWLKLIITKSIRTRSCFTKKNLRDLKSLIQSYTHSFLLPASRFLDRFYRTYQPHPGKILGLVDPVASPSQRIPIIPRHRLPQREHQSHLRWNRKTHRANYPGTRTPKSEICNRSIIQTPFFWGFCVGFRK